MAFTEDLTEFFDTDDFAVAAIFGSSTVYGIFDKEYVEVTLGRSTFSGYKPIFTCAYSGVSDVARNSSVAVSGETATFKVAEVRHDGTGEATVILVAQDGDDLEMLDALEMLDTMEMTGS